MFNVYGRYCWHLLKVDFSMTIAYNNNNEISTSMFKSAATLDLY